jgi:pyruvate formate lyase activating enzyme
VGQNVEVSDLLKSILEDKPYYNNSSGGVTFSGGEAMLQIDYLEEILRRCKDEKIHTAVDTAGCVPWDYFERILPVTDLFLYDVKAADPIRHKQLTGVDNHLILTNLRRLSKADKDLWIRIPFIPGQNNDQMEGIAQILSPLKITKVEVMAYHKLGNSKYTALGLNNELLGMNTPPDEQVEDAVKIFKAYGLNANRT